MGVTPKLRLPYPELSEPADVPTDMHELALALDGILGTPAALPGSPVTGQRTLYSPAAGVVWDLLYDGTGWVFIGGNALQSYVPTLSTFSATTYGDPTTGPVGPTLTLPLAGTYEVTHAATLAASGAGIAAIQSYGIAGAAAADTESIWQGNQQPLSTGNYYSVASAARRHTVVAGAVLATKYRASVAGTCNAQYRSLRAVPVKL